MKEATLVIMAAGMGSRYGGLKQIEAVDECGHILMDYSVYDAIRAGFRRAVFIIKEEIYADFKAITDSRLNKWGIRLDLVFQELAALPDGYSVPAKRKKPWGTAHAIACLDGVVDSPFAVINADDYYGPSAFQKIHDRLTNTDDESVDCFMVGYRLKNTLSENGAVSRGICRVENGCLKEIREVSGIYQRSDGVITSRTEELDGDAVVSMNLWGLTPKIIGECKGRFGSFLDRNLASNPIGCEYYLPELISDLIAEGGIRVHVIESDETWQGMTYREDKRTLSAALRLFEEREIYPRDF